MKSQGVYYSSSTDPPIMLKIFTYYIEIFSTMLKNLSIVHNILLILSIVYFYW